MLECVRKKETPNGIARTSCSCENGGEVNRPTYDMSQASDASRVVATWSVFVSRLHLLKSKTIGVYSLLTSMRDLGS